MLRWRHLAQAQAAREAEGGQEAHEERRQRPSSPRGLLGHSEARPMNTSSERAAVGSASHTPDELRALALRVSATATAQGQVEYVEAIPFGPALSALRFRLANGLGILLAPDHSAKVISAHT